MSAPLLATAGLTKRFGGIDALSGIDFEVAPGEAVGIAGPNGAGKTTLFNCLFGLLEPDDGEIRFEGRRIDTEATWRRARLGIGRTFQRLELFGGMTVAEHLLVAKQAIGGRIPFLADVFQRRTLSDEDHDAVWSTLELLGLTADANRPVEALSLGHLRLVELGRALVGEPRLLLLDEPSSGLDAHETERVAEILRSVRVRAGAAIVLVEHDLHLIESVVERLYVLDFGHLLTVGSVDDVLADPKFREAYLGSES